MPNVESGGMHDAIVMHQWCIIVVLVSVSAITED